MRRTTVVALDPGQPLAERALQLLLEGGLPVELVVSRGAMTIWQAELGIQVPRLLGTKCIEQPTDGCRHDELDPRASGGGSRRVASSNMISAARARARRRRATVGRSSMHIRLSNHRASTSP